MIAFLAGALVGIAVAAAAFVLFVRWLVRETELATARQRRYTLRQVAFWNLVGAECSLRWHKRLHQLGWADCDSLPILAAAYRVDADCIPEDVCAAATEFVGCLEHGEEGPAWVRWQEGTGGPWG